MVARFSRGPDDNGERNHYTTIFASSVNEENRFLSAFRPLDTRWFFALVVATVKN